MVKKKKIEIIRSVALNANLIDPNWRLFVSTEAALHSLLRALTSETYNDPTQHLEREQALAKQFAEILHFTLRFDELKVRTIPQYYTSIKIHLLRDDNGFCFYYLFLFFDCSHCIN